MDGGLNSSGLLMDTKDFGDLLTVMSDQNKKDEKCPDLVSVKSRFRLPTARKLFENDSAASLLESCGGKKFVGDDQNETRRLVQGNGSKRRVNNDTEVASCLFGLKEGKMSSDNDNEVGNSLELAGGSNAMDKEVKCGDNRSAFSGSEVRPLVGLDRVKMDVGEDKDVTSIDLDFDNKDNFSLKRKRGSFMEMLNWVTKVAKDPCDPVIGKLLEMSKWKFSGGEECWKQALFTRETLFLKRPTDTISDQSALQKKQKMHPSLYDDHIIASHQSADRLRCSQRLLSAKKFLPRSSSDSSSYGSQSDSENNFTEDNLDKNSLRTANEDYAAGLSGNNNIRKRVPVGRCFQAKVPGWTGVASDSDSKWLGTRVWPGGKTNPKHPIERERIGKGRQDSCGCRVPNSVQCVRFHVVLKRERLGLELDSAFYSWKFDEMGETVGLSWTEEDKKKFEATVRSNPPSLEKCFWDEIYKAFPFKSREDLVSYYFNVFLVQRRAYQNRHTPSNINSDDDDEESEMGSSPKNKAIRSPASLLHAKSRPGMNSRN